MGNVSVVEILLENGAIMDDRDKVGKIYSVQWLIVIHCIYRYPPIPYIDWTDSI